jgi:hypothetical protein
MSAIFGHYRTEHHPDAMERLGLASSYLREEIDDRAVGAMLRARDRETWLEMESSTLAGILINPMVEVFPRRKFFLTLRDAYSWCDSWLDHNINHPPSPTSPWAQLDRTRLRVDDHAPTKFDTPLIEHGQFPLACYFQLWRAHNQAVLDAVPEDRLMIVKTHEIVDSIPRIASWLGIDPGSLLPEHGWEFAAPEKHGILRRLDDGYLRETAQRFCGELMNQYFPDLR